MTEKKTHKEELNLLLSLNDREKTLGNTEAASSSATQFLNESDLIGVNQALADRANFGLNAEQWETFLSALDREPRYHQRLERLLNEPSIFDKTVKG